MTDSQRREHFEQPGGLGAAYLTNAFLIRLPPWLKILGDDGQIDVTLLEPANATRFAIFVHEYVHLLHNFSTIAGFVQFATYRELATALSHAKHATEWCSVGSGQLAAEAQKYIVDRIKLLERINGTLRLSQPCSDNAALKVLSIHVDAGETGAFVPAMAEIEVTDSGSSRIEKCLLGFGAIEEGIAWAIEQATGTNLQAIDAPPPLPAFPYTILAAVIERVAPGLSSEIGTKLALLALNTHQPWRSLLAWLLRVHAASDEPAELDAIVREWRSNWPLLLQVVRQELNDLATAYARRGLAELGMRATLNVCQRLFQWRTHDPFLEFAFTSGARPWPELFARGPACELLVERDTPDENDLLASLRTLGGGDVRNTDDDVASRRVLHAQEHFLRMHLQSRGFRDSAAAERSASAYARCPYYDACDLPLRDADLCRTAPWRQAREHTPVCWYGHAVLAIFSLFESWERLLPDP